MTDYARLVEERRRNPIRCDTCSDAAGHDVFFEPETLAWFHCPLCGQHGFLSVYGGCTGCANERRFGTRDGWSAPEREERE